MQIHHYKKIIVDKNNKILQLKTKLKNYERRIKHIISGLDYLLQHPYSASTQGISYRKVKKVNYD